MTTTKQYDYLNRLTFTGSTPASGVGNGAPPLPSFSYVYNQANQRTAATNTDNTHWLYQYDSLGQVISGKRYWSDGTPVAGQQFEYGFDDIGNRRLTKAGGDANGANLRQAAYTANNLNQYTSRDVPGYATVLGSANPNATVTVNLQRAYRYGNYFQDELSVDNSSAALWLSLTNLAVLNNGTNADIVATNVGNAFVAQTPETFGYDADGNLTNDGRFTYTWDGENRLINLTSLASAPTGSKVKLDFTYDYQGRRIQKIVSLWNTNTLNYQPSTTNRFVYDGWNLVAILDSQSLGAPEQGGGGSILASFTWGTDLSGSMQGAGGVGGLISMTAYSGTNAGTYFYSFDGNGNVAALVNAANGALAAQYEYDPFLGITRASGALAFVNPFLGSTKFFDAETGLYYYGYRYYDPSTGRWSTRDPIEEEDGLNMFQFARNDPISFSDRNGLDVNYPPITAQPPIIPPPLVSTAGPDITDALEATLKQVSLDWKNNPDKHCKACANLNFPRAFYSWDIIVLRELGAAKPPPFLVGGKHGTGDWERTLQFRYGGGISRVYWASAMNYTLWGKANALCYAEYHTEKWSLSRTLESVHYWKFAYIGDQDADAQAFTRYGYDGSSPESAFLPTGRKWGVDGQSFIYSADSNNIYPDKTYFPYHWEGLINGK